MEVKRNKAHKIKEKLEMKFFSFLALVISITFTTFPANRALAQGAHPANSVRCPIGTCNKFGKGWAKSIKGCKKRKFCPKSK